MVDYSPWVAFIGGLLSFVSPCVLPVIPVYFASLAAPKITPGDFARWRLPIFLQSLSFCVGFSTIFILLGTGAGWLGFAISHHLMLVHQISGGLMILLGLFMLAATRISWLNYEKHFSNRMDIASSYLRSLILGLLFAFAWTPCVGPLLGAILTLALGSESAWQGGYLLSIYSLGMVLPFLIIGLAFDSIYPRLKHLSRYNRYIYVASGIILIGMGILILINRLNWFSL